MTTPAESDIEQDRCPDCGLLYVHGYAPDERYHRKIHDETLNGHRAKLPDGFHPVTHESPISLQKLAQAAASAAQHETHYDFSSFVAFKKKHDEDKTIAMIYINAGRVCGLLVTRERECKFTASLNSFHLGGDDSRPTETRDVEPHVRRAVDMIWVLRKMRNQGVAKGLAQALASHCGMKIGDLAHMVPFTESALNLWKALKMSTIYVV